MNMVAEYLKRFFQPRRKHDKIKWNILCYKGGVVYG